MPTLPIKSARILLGITLALSILVVLPGLLRLVELSGLAAATEAEPRYTAQPAPILAHILTAVPYILLAPWSVHWGLTKQRQSAHRAFGPLVMLLGFGTAASGLWAVLALPLAAGELPVMAWLRASVSLAMLGAILMSVQSLRERRYRIHAAWSLRTYALATGALTQAVFFVPLFLTIGLPGPGISATVMGAAWGANVAFAELLIRRRPLAGSKDLV